MIIRKLLVLTGSVIVMALGAFSIKAQAAPVKQADGNYFDAAFYAQQNPDVVAVFGNKSDMLYAHYVYFGKAEGRLPYNLPKSMAAVERHGEDEIRGPEPYVCRDGTVWQAEI